MTVTQTRIWPTRAGINIFSNNLVCGWCYSIKNTKNPEQNLFQDNQANPCNKNHRLFSLWASWLAWYQLRTSSRHTQNKQLPMTADCRACSNVASQLPLSSLGPLGFPPQSRISRLEAHRDLQQTAPSSPNSPCQALHLAGRAQEKFAHQKRTDCLRLCLPPLPLLFF